MWKLPISLVTKQKMNVKGMIVLDLVKIKSITKRQAKAYMLMALRNLKISSNEITEQSMWDEMETLMRLFTPKQVVDKAILHIDDTFRVKNMSKNKKI